MTGPEHYVEAERMLRAAGYDTAEDASVVSPDEATIALLGAAQVHADLARAAAAGLLVPDDGYGSAPEWRRAVMPGMGQGEVSS